MKNFLLIWLAILLLSLSCEKNNSGTAKETKAEVVKKEIDFMSDSVSAAYKKMISVDDQKWADVKRLLDEISYTSDYDVTLHDSLVKQLPAVKAKRFDETLDVNAMDAYDVVTDNYIRKVYELKGKSKEIQSHPLADELVQDINKANSSESTAQLRAKYDSWATAYNAYLRDHKKQLEKLGEPYASLTPKAEIIQKQ